MRLDWQQLVRALEHSEEGQYGVDPKTGEVRFFGDDEDLNPEDAWDESRFLMVESLAPWQYQEWVEEFAEFQDPPLAGKLTKAASSASPLAAVARVLREYPKIKEAWRGFLQGKLQQAAEEWVQKNGLRPENPPPWSVR